MSRHAQTAGRPCARPGCRAWAMRSGAFCSAHRADGSHTPTTSPDPADSTDARRERADAFIRLVRAGRHEELIEATLKRVIDGLAEDRTLRAEIGVLRLQLQHFVAVDALEGDPHKVTASMTRIVETIVRAMRMQHALSGDLAETVTAAFSTVLTEMGLGDEP